ncbi:hypothetical protein [Kitasatospora sp. NPDC002040]|uniref:hypothetical protein n=1 Tax=Kitasatospora sp. NPDC002040 TaxID=3154661 RepID=UPI0033177705
MTMPTTADQEALISDQLAKKLVALQKASPAAFDVVVKRWKSDQEHAQKMELAPGRSVWICRIAALGAVAALCVLAWHAIDKGYAAEGVTIVTSLAASLAFVFITGRLTDGDKKGSSGKE